MKIFSALLSTETNTSAVVATGLADFEQGALYRGDASLRDPAGFGAAYLELQALAQRDGHEVVEGLTAFAQPAGVTVGSVYEQLREWILQDIRDAMPIQAVILFLHGAMVADGYNDCEGDLLAQVRALVGPDVPIGIELDLHCHFSEAMRTEADIAICYKEYPHTDTLDRLRELYRLVVQQTQGSIRPVTAVCRLPMIGLWHTTREPMRAFVQTLQAHEGKDGILSVSLGHSFPWGDVPDSGACLWVVADNDVNRAQALADQLAEAFWHLRDQTWQPPVPVNTAIQAIQSTAHCIVLADVADNAGGGAMSDSTFILQSLIDAGLGDVALGAFWDPGAVALCQSAGVGAALNLRIGGKCGPLSGHPVDVAVRVMRIESNLTQRGLNQQWSLGTAVWVRSESGLDIVLNTVRCQVFSTEVFEKLGIELAARRAVVVKSAQHFHASFSAIADQVIYVGAPGTMSQQFSDMHYQQRDNQFWPRVASPLLPWLRR